MSLFEYQYPQLNAEVELKQFGCSVAHLDDPACMKLVAIAQRGTKKNFVNIYTIALKHKLLRQLVRLY